ncbi:serine hydrolase [Paludisphaera soli]|uniref:serine hydrolase n=1 Tax=Paludisphaera soli TaxID=2712865 RepID=UPI0013EABFE6|nr:serine hydrolase [Paludisphaera soli]
MARPIRPLILAVLTSLGLVAAADAQQAPPDPLAGLDAYIENAMRDWDLPGLAIAIVKDDAVAYTRGFGVLEAGKPGPVTDRSLFAMASNSKAFTATAVGLLVEEGRLRWDDRVADRLPDFQLFDPSATRALTVRDLLCHRVGLGTWQGDLIWYGSDRSVPEVLRLVRHIPPDHDFRDRYAYCNLTFLAAGEVLAAIGGEPWDVVVRRRFFEPLGMSRSSTSVRDLEGVEDVARPHTLIDGKVAAIGYRNLDNAGAAGGINSCVRDWARWMRLQLNEGTLDGERVVPAAVIRETRTPQQVIRPISERQRSLFPSSHFFAYGLGWFLQDYRGRMVLSHGGGMDGMLSLTVLVPEEKLGVVVVTNYDEQDLYRAVPFRVVDAYLEAEPRDWSGELLRERRDQDARVREAAEKQRAEPAGATDPRPSLDLARYVGVYRHEALGDAVVSLKDGSLRLEVERNAGLRADLKHRDGDLFEAAWADPFYRSSAIPFRLDDAGAPVEFRLSVRPDFIDPMQYVFTRRR